MNKVLNTVESKPESVFKVVVINPERLVRTYFIKTHSILDAELAVTRYMLDPLIPYEVVVEVY